MHGGGLTAWTKYPSILVVAMRTFSFRIRNASTQFPVARPSRSKEYGRACRTKLFPQLMKSYENLKLITVFTRARHVSLLRAKWFVTTHYLLRSLSCYYPICDCIFKVGSFLQGLQQIVCIHVRYMPGPFNSPDNKSIQQAIQITKYLIMQFPLGPKYSLRHPVLKYSQSVFLLSRQRRSFTQINNREYYRYCHVY
jgi:hypothetical protein